MLEQKQEIEKDQEEHNNFYSAENKEIEEEKLEKAEHFRT